jgi:hypothetical protein
MMEPSYIIQMNIDHYREMLKLELERGKRSVVNRLLAEAMRDLVAASDSGRETRTAHTSTVD